MFELQPSKPKTSLARFMTFPPSTYVSFGPPPGPGRWEMYSGPNFRLSLTCKEGIQLTHWEKNIQCTVGLKGMVPWMLIEQLDGYWWLYASNRCPVDAPDINQEEKQRRGNIWAGSPGPDIINNGSVFIGRHLIWPPPNYSSIPWECFQLEHAKSLFWFSFEQLNAKECHGNTQIPLSRT